MNWMTILAIVSPILQLGSQIAHAWETTPGSGFDKIGSIIKGTQLVQELEQIGSAIWPKASPTLHAAAAALLISHPNSTSWLQSSLNVVKASGAVNFGADLVVDGIFGRKTFAAVEALQAHYKLPVTGLAADAEYAIINAALAKL